jgi:hypothetical protein
MNRWIFCRSELSNLFFFERLSLFLVSFHVSPIYIHVRVSDPHWFNADPDTDPHPRFVLYSGRVFLSNMPVPYLFSKICSIFGTCFLVKYAGTVPFFFIRDVFSCLKVRYRTFFLSMCLLFMFMSGFLIRIDLMRIRIRIRIQDLFYIRDVFSCQICRYRTFFLYLRCVFLSKSTVPYLFSLFGTCFLVKYAGTVPFLTRKHVPNKEKRYGSVLFDNKTHSE